MMDYRKSALVPYDKREAMTVSAPPDCWSLALQFGLWCEEYDIARKIVAGNWAVSRVALHMLLNEDLEALDAYGSGERSIAP